MTSNQQFLTKFLKDIVHNPMDRQRILNEAVVELNLRDAELLQQREVV
jgi:hypothetical protein